MSFVRVDRVILFIEISVLMRGISRQQVCIVADHIDNKTYSHHQVNTGPDLNQSKVKS